MCCDLRRGKSRDCFVDMGLVGQEWEQVDQLKGPTALVQVRQMEAHVLMAGVAAEKWVRVEERQKGVHALMPWM